MAAQGLVFQLQVKNELKPSLKAFAKMWPGVMRGAKEAAMMAWHGDVLMEKPTPAFRIGNLRGAITAYIGKNKVIGGGPQINASGKKGVGYMVGGTPYGHFQHELNKDDPSKTKYSNPDPNIGPLFVEQKMIDYGPEYMEEMTAYVKARARRLQNKVMGKSEDWKGPR